jgi:hypothetical protein
MIGHASFYRVKDIETDWEAAVEQARDIGLEYMTNAWIK